jgi:hypothetical protein
MARTVVKKGPNFVLYDDGCLRIDNLRASYPHVAEPWAKNDKDRKKFSITGLGDKETHGEAKSVCVEIINQLLADRKMGKIGAEHKFCRDGDNAGKDECEGMWLFKASENADRTITVRSRSGAKITEKSEIEKLIYPGCYVNVLLRPWAQDNEHGKKINANFIAVQFVKDGERFGEGAIDDEDAFDSLGEDDYDFEQEDDDL